MIVSDKLKERLIKLDDSDLASRLAQCKRSVRGDTTPSGLRPVEIEYAG